MAEDDFELARRNAVVGERGAVVSVGGRGRARVLEEIGVGGGLASVGAVEVAPAAELVRPERLATALARHHVPGGAALLQRRGAGGDEIGAAADHRADAFPLVWGDGQGDVEAVNEADEIRALVVVAVVEVELGEGGGAGSTGAVAF